MRPPRRTLTSGNYTRCRLQIEESIGVRFMFRNVRLLSPSGDNVLKMFLRSLSFAAFTLATAASVYAAQSRFPSTDHLFLSTRNPPEYALSSELVARAVGRVPPLGNSGRVTLVFM